MWKYITSFVWLKIMFYFYSLLLFSFPWNNTHVSTKKSCAFAKGGVICNCQIRLRVRKRKRRRRDRERRVTETAQCKQLVFFINLLFLRFSSVVAIIVFDSDLCVVKAAEAEITLKSFLYIQTFVVNDKGILLLKSTSIIDKLLG